MQVKIIDALSAKSLEKKVNEFLSENEHLDVKNIQFAAGFGSLNALIAYEE